MQQATTTWPASPSHVPAPSSAAFSDPQSSRPIKRNVLAERGVRSLLANSGYGALSDIECSVQGADVSLHGHVHLYYHKQMAQEIAGRYAGIRRVKNFIRVIE